jgi:hypothetical protein
MSNHSAVNRSQGLLNPLRALHLLMNANIAGWHRVARAQRRTLNSPSVCESVGPKRCTALRRGPLQNCREHPMVRREVQSGEHYVFNVFSVSSIVLPNLLAFKLLWPDKNEVLQVEQCACVKHFSL